MTRICAVALLAFSISTAVRAEDTKPPVIEHTPVTSVAKGSKWMQVFAKITDESKFFPQVFWRSAPGAYEKPVDMKAVKGEKHMYGGNVPIKDGAPYVEYYIEAYDELGNGPARSGDPEKPIRVDLGNGAVAQATPAPAGNNPWAHPNPPAPTPAPAPVATTPAPAPAPAPAGSNWASNSPPPARTSASSGGGRTWTWVVGGVGAGVLVSGILAGAVFKTEDDAYKQRVAENPAQPPSLAAQYSANKSLGRDATILMIAGGVLVAGGAALYFLEPGWSGNKVADNSKTEGSGIAVAAAPVDGGGAVAVAGRF